MSADEKHSCYGDPCEACFEEEPEEQEDYVCDEEDGEDECEQGEAWQVFG